MSAQYKSSDPALMSIVDDSCASLSGSIYGDDQVDMHSQRGLSQIEQPMPSYCEHGSSTNRVLNTTPPPSIAPDLALVSPQSTLNAPVASPKAHLLTPFSSKNRRTASQQMMFPPAPISPIALTPTGTPKMSSSRGTKNASMLDDLDLTDEELNISFLPIDDQHASSSVTPTLLSAAKTPLTRTIVSKTGSNSDSHAFNNKINQTPPPGMADPVLGSNHQNRHILSTPNSLVSNSVQANSHFNTDNSFVTRQPIMHVISSPFSDTTNSVSPACPLEVILNKNESDAKTVTAGIGSSITGSPRNDDHVITYGEASLSDLHSHVVQPIRHSKTQNMLPVTPVVQVTMQPRQQRLLSVDPITSRQSQHTSQFSNLVHNSPMPHSSMDNHRRHVMYTPTIGNTASLPPLPQHTTGRLQSQTFHSPAIELQSHLLSATPTLLQTTPDSNGHSRNNNSNLGGGGGNIPSNNNQSRTTTMQYQAQQLWQRQNQFDGRSIGSTSSLSPYGNSDNLHTPLPTDRTRQQVIGNSTSPQVDQCFASSSPNSPQSQGLTLLPLPTIPPNNNSDCGVISTTDSINTTFGIGIIQNNNDAMSLSRTTNNDHSTTHNFSRTNSATNSVISNFYQPNPLDSRVAIPKPSNSREIPIRAPVQSHHARLPLQSSQQSSALPPLYPQRAQNDPRDKMDDTKPSPVIDSSPAVAVETPPLKPPPTRRTREPAMTHEQLIEKIQSRSKLPVSEELTLEYMDSLGRDTHQGLWGTTATVVAQQSKYIADTAVVLNNGTDPTTGCRRSSRPRKHIDYDEDDEDESDDDDEEEVYVKETRVRRTRTHRDEEEEDDHDETYDEDKRGRPVYRPYVRAVSPKLNMRPIRSTRHCKKPVQPYVKTQGVVTRGSIAAAVAEARAAEAKTASLSSPRSYRAMHNNILETITPPPVPSTVSQDDQSTNSDLNDSDYQQIIYDLSQVDGTQAILSILGPCGPRGKVIKAKDKDKRMCTCRKSRCVKMYCMCYSFGDYCGPDCQCRPCSNRKEKEDARVKAKVHIMSRDPNAFYRSLLQRFELFHDVTEIQLLLALIEAQAMASVAENPYHSFAQQICLSIEYNHTFGIHHDILSLLGKLVCLSQNIHEGHTSSLPNFGKRIKPERIIIRDPEALRKLAHNSFVDVIDTMIFRRFEMRCAESGSAAIKVNPNNPNANPLALGIVTDMYNAAVALDPLAARVGSNEYLAQLPNNGMPLPPPSTPHTTLAVFETPMPADNIIEDESHHSSPLRLSETVTMATALSSTVPLHQLSQFSSPQPHDQSDKPHHCHSIRPSSVTSISGSQLPSFLRSTTPTRHDAFPQTPLQSIGTRTHSVISNVGQLFNSNNDMTDSLHDFHHHHTPNKPLLTGHMPPSVISSPDQNKVLNSIRRLASSPNHFASPGVSTAYSMSRPLSPKLPPQLPLPSSSALPQSPTTQPMQSASPSAPAVLFSPTMFPPVPRQNLPPPSLPPARADTELLSDQHHQISDQNQQQYDIDQSDSHFSRIDPLESENIMASSSSLVRPRSADDTSSRSTSMSDRNASFSSHIPSDAQVVSTTAESSLSYLPVPANTPTMHPRTPSRARQSPSHQDDTALLPARRSPHHASRSSPSRQKTAMLGPSSPARSSSTPVEQNPTHETQAMAILPQLPSSTVSVQSDPIPPPPPLPFFFTICDIHRVYIPETSLSSTDDPSSFIPRPLHLPLDSSSLDPTPSPADASSTLTPTPALSAFVHTNQVTNMPIGFNKTGQSNDLDVVVDIDIDQQPPTKRPRRIDSTTDDTIVHLGAPVNDAIIDLDTSVDDAMIDLDALTIDLDDFSDATMDGTMVDRNALADDTIIDLDAIADNTIIDLDTPAEDTMVDLDSPPVDLIDLDTPPPANLDTPPADIDALPADIDTPPPGDDIAPQSDIVPPKRDKRVTYASLEVYVPPARPCKKKKRSKKNDLPARHIQTRGSQPQ